MAIMLSMGLLLTAAWVVNGAACPGKTCRSSRNSGTLLVQTRVKGSLGAHDEPLEALPTADMNRSLGASSDRVATPRTNGSSQFTTAGEETYKALAKLENVPLHADSNSKTSAANEQADNMSDKPVLETSHADNTQEQPDTSSSKRVQSGPSSGDSTSNVHTMEKQVDNVASKIPQDELPHADNSPVATAHRLEGYRSADPMQTVISHAGGSSKTTTDSAQNDTPTNLVPSTSKVHASRHILERNATSQAPDQHLQQLADIFNRAVEIAEGAENNMPEQANSTHAANHSNSSTVEEQADNMSAQPAQDETQHAGGTSKNAAKDEALSTSSYPVQNATQQAGGSSSISDEPVRNRLPHAENKSSTNATKEHADDFSGKPLQNKPSPADGSSNSRSASKQTNDDTAKPAQNKLPHTKDTSGLNAAYEHADIIAGEPVQNKPPLAGGSLNGAAKEGFANVSAKPIGSEITHAVGNPKIDSAIKQTNKAAAKPAQSERAHAGDSSSMNSSWEQSDGKSDQVAQDGIQAKDGGSNITAEEQAANISAKSVRNLTSHPDGSSSIDAAEGNSNDMISAKPAQHEASQEDDSSTTPKEHAQNGTQMTGNESMQYDRSSTMVTDEEQGSANGSPVIDTAMDHKDDRFAKPVQNVMPLNDAEGRSNLTSAGEQAIDSVVPVQNTPEPIENRSIYQGNMNRMSKAEQASHGPAESASKPLDVANGTQDETADKARAMLNKSEKEGHESLAPVSGPGGDETNASLKHINELAKASVKAAADAMARKSVEAAAGSRVARKRAEQEEAEQEDESRQAAKAAEAAQRELEAAKGRLEAASEKRLNTTMRAASDEAEVKRHMAEGALQAAITAATSALKAAEETKKAYSEIHGAYRRGAKHACTTSAPVHAWSWFSGAVRPGTPCLFGVDPRDEGLHCIDKGGRQGKNGWCYTDAAAGVWPSWGPCADSCDWSPTFPSNSSASKEDDDPRKVQSHLLEKLRQRLQALMAHLYVLESS